MIQVAKQEGLIVELNAAEILVEQVRRIEEQEYIKSIRMSFHCNMLRLLEYISYSSLPAAALTSISYLFISCLILSHSYSPPHSPSTRFLGW